MSASSILALGWLAVFALAVHLGVPVPDGLGWAVFFATLASIVYLYIRLCRRFPLFGWIGLGLIAGLFGGGYYHTHTTTVVERDYDDTDCNNYGDNCDGDA